jgi:hypothetical protein
VLFQSFERGASGTSPLISIHSLTNHYVQDSVGHVLVTMDIWLDQNHWSYLAMTAHWITRLKETGALQLWAALITFHHLCVGHDSKSLANIAIGLLDRAGHCQSKNTPPIWLMMLLITFEIGHFTLDNASHNDMIMKEMKILVTLNLMQLIKRLCVLAMSLTSAWAV